MKCKIYAILALCLFLFSSCTPVIDIVGNEYSESIFYNGDEYESERFYCTSDDRTFIGQIDDARYVRVYSVGSGEYIELVGSDDSGFFIKKDSKVPTSGAVTKVLVDPSYRDDRTKYLDADDELAMIEELTKISGEPQTFYVDNYFTNGNTFYYVYNNSNVSCKDNYGGYIAFTYGKWIYAAPENEPVWIDETNAVTIEAIVIDDKELIEKMCKTDLTKSMYY